MVCCSILEVCRIINTFYHIIFLTMLFEEEYDISDQRAEVFVKVPQLFLNLTSRTITTG